MYATSPRARQGHRWNRFGVADFIIYAALFLSAAVCLVPVFNIVALSLSHAAAANAGIVGFWPVNFTLASYHKIVQEGVFFRAFWVSVQRVVIGTSMSMILMFVMAYPLSREPEQFRLRNPCMWYLVFTMLFSGGLIPTYITVTKLGLTDSMWALVLPGAVSTYNTILMMNFFRGIPRELDEAAAIDGASPWRILFTIYLPISLPVIATLALFCMMWHWNDYFTGLIYINDAAKYPLQTYIRNLTVDMDFDTMSHEELIQRMEIGAITFNAAKIVISMIPVMVVYPFLQKYFVKGLVLGSVKG